MVKRYKNVVGLINALSSNEEHKEAIKNEIARKGLAKFLFALRCEHKLTQEELAERIGCTQSRISKIESSYDEDLSVKDFKDYGKALGLQLGEALGKPVYIMYVASEDLELLVGHDDYRYNIKTNKLTKAKMSQW